MCITVGNTNGNASNLEWLTETVSQTDRRAFLIKGDSEIFIVSAHSGGSKIFVHKSSALR